MLQNSITQISSKKGWLEKNILTRRHCSLSFSSRPPPPPSYRDDLHLPAAAATTLPPGKTLTPRSFSAAPDDPTQQARQDHDAHPALHWISISSLSSPSSPWSTPRWLGWGACTWSADLACPRDLPGAPRPVCRQLAAPHLRAQDHRRRPTMNRWRPQLLSPHLLVDPTSTTRKPLGEMRVGHLQESLFSDVMKASGMYASVADSPLLYSCFFTIQEIGRSDCATWTC
jgi:hypothetical protein